MLEFQRAQQRLGAHIRDPQAQPPPEGIEDRRLAIYRRLFFNNIDGFLRSGFPVLRKCYPESDWRELVRDFMRQHRCRTPYFGGIGGEFLSYLRETRAPARVAADPPFLVDLAHYEWIELALDRAPDDLERARAGVDPDGDLLSGHPVVSPLACSLAYDWPVHRIGAEFRPTEPGPEKTFLVVYRNRQERVRFLQANAATAALIALCESPEGLSGARVLEHLAKQLGAEREALSAFGLETLRRLLELDILLGVSAAGESA